MPMYLIMDSDHPGTLVLIDGAKRQEQALNHVIESRFTVTAVDAREAFNLGKRGAKLIDLANPGQQEHDMPRFLQKSGDENAAVAPVETEASGEAGFPPVTASPVYVPFGPADPSLTGNAADVDPDKSGKSLFERMSAIAKQEAPAHEEVQADG